MRHRGPGFTLVEMLVAFSVVVLLAGIVFAALAPAREKAHQAVCASNLHQIHLALMLYAADYGGAEPDGSRTYWQLGLPPPGSQGFGHYGNGGAFLQYLKDPRLWICPNDPCTAMVAFHPECRDNPRRCCESYIMPLYWDGTAPWAGPFPEVVAKCGRRLPLYYCPLHGSAQGVSSYVLVLRWDGRVEGVYRREPWTPCLN
jgi:type II secretory pathway pseudopilin PulG